MANRAGYRTCSTVRLPAGRGRSSSLSGRVSSSQSNQSGRSSTTICRSWIGTTSGPGAVVNKVKASGVAATPGRHSPAKQNQSASALVNRYVDFGDLAPVNS